MSNWKDSVKSLGNSAAKALSGSTKIVIGAVQEQVKDSSRKRQIIDKMYAGTIRELARQRGLHLETLSGNQPTIDDYKGALASKMSLKELIDFAKKKRIDIRDITDKIDEDISNKEQKKLEKDTDSSNEFKQVAQCIRDFKPLKNYPNEYPYQAELTQFLRARFPKTNIEIQRGSSRPDIYVNGIAIEVKGPTCDREIVSIADKLMRYPQWFPKGVIVILFDLQVNPHRYLEWEKGIRDTFGRQGNFDIIKRTR